MTLDSLTESFFRPGVLPEDLPALFPLLQAQKSLSVFTALFHGGDEEVIIRLLVLREIGSRGEAPQWSTQELRSHFAYLDETKLNTVLLRLRSKGLLVWDAESSYYQVSSEGRMALSALSTLLKFSADDGGEIGYINSQLAAGLASGTVSEEDLQHLLSRLNELQQEFNAAVVSGASSRIESAEQKLNSVLAWVEKGTETIRLITADQDLLDLSTHRVAQKIGQVQSRMLRMDSVFQRTLNQLERQKVHLGATGLSSADINRWLRGQTVQSLEELFSGSSRIPLKKGFVLGDVCLDVAEYELIEKVRYAEEEAVLPPQSSAPVVAADENAQGEDFHHLFDLQQDLDRVGRATPIAEVIPDESYEQACYRLSMLSLLGDEGSDRLVGPIGDFMKNKLMLKVVTQRVEVASCGIEEMSDGLLIRTDAKQEDRGGD